MSQRLTPKHAGTPIEPDDLSSPHMATWENVLGGRLICLPPLPGLIVGNWALIKRRDLNAWTECLEQLEARYTFGGLRDDELEYVAGA